MTPPATRWRVVDVVAETSDTRSFVLTGEEPTPSYRPGQFLTVKVPSETAGSVARSYSFSSAPGIDGRPRITVKRTPGGYASNWLCDNLAAGDQIETLSPGGVFTPPDLDVPLLLAAAGSGITPVLSILKASLARGRSQVALFYASRDEQSVIFAGELRELQREYGDRLVVVHWLESLQGLPDPGIAGHLAPFAAREAYVCGPQPFMELTEQVLIGLGAAPDRIHAERFTSLTVDPFASPRVHDEPAGSVRVVLGGGVHDLAWPKSATLLDVLLAAGLDAPYSCREGACSACACVVLEGVVEMATNQVLDESDLADGLVLGCQARPVTDHVRVSYDA